MRKLIHINRYILCVSILLSSCAINRTIPMKDLDASIVPSDFNPQRHILLVLEIPRKNKPDERHQKLTQQMDELLKKYYPYKYEIVSMEQVRSDSPKYTDTSIYKYAIMNSFDGVQHTTHTTVTTSGGSHTVSPTATTTYISYYFYDRFNNKNYRGSYRSAWLKTSVQAFANTVKKAKGAQVKI